MFGQELDMDKRIERQLDVLKRYIAEDGTPYTSVSSEMAASAISIIEELLNGMNRVIHQENIPDPRQAKPL